MAVSENNSSSGIHIILQIPNSSIHILRHIIAENQKFKIGTGYHIQMLNAGQS